MDNREELNSFPDRSFPLGTGSIQQRAGCLTAGALVLTIGLSACAASPSTTTPGQLGGAPTRVATPTNTPPETQNTVTPPAARSSAVGSANTSADSSADTSADTDSGYRDGEYFATGWYGGLPSHHVVTLTIESGAVTAVEITTPADDETSLGYQKRFAEALPDAIVGRTIDELTVDRLAGASGCSEGFMDALARIKEQAAA